MKLNIIHGRNPTRLPRLLKELEIQGIVDYELWESLYKKTTAESINAAHKQIIEYADVAEWEEICIAEDDLKFTAPGAWKHFLNNKPNPNEYDIYLSGIYLGDLSHDNTVDEFCGLHLYFVSRKFYSVFLSVPPEEHIDRAMKGLGRFVVCNPFAAIQFNGFSNNTGKDEVYDNLLQGRNLFGS